jgi:hypothetical protein
MSKKKVELSEKEKEIQRLEKLRDKYVDKAWELRDKIDKLKLEGINFERKFVARSSGYGAPFNDYMIVESQQITEIRGRKEVMLTGLTFYMMDNPNYSDAAEVFFSGNYTWTFSMDDFLNLDTNKKLKEIDKDTFIAEVKKYTKTIESFIDGWINKFVNAVENPEKDE